MPIQLQLEITVDDKGAVTAMKQLGQTAEETGKKSSDAFKQGAESLAKWMIGIYSAHQAYEFFRRNIEKGIEDAMQEDRIMRGLTATMAQFGMNSRAGAVAISDFADEMIRAGIADERTMGMVQRMLPITRNYESAILATRIAIGLFVKEGKDMEGTLELLSALIVGSPRGLMMAQKQYGIEVDKSLPKMQQLQSALDQLRARGEGAATGADDAATKWAFLKETWNKAWMEGGKNLIDALASLEQHTTSLSNVVEISRTINNLWATEMHKGPVAAAISFREEMERLGVKLSSMEGTLAKARELIFGGGNLAPRDDKAEYYARIASLIEGAKTETDKYIETTAFLRQAFMVGDITLQQFQKILASLSPTQKAAEQDTYDFATAMGTLVNELLKFDQIKPDKAWWATTRPEMPTLGPTMASGAEVPTPLPDYSAEMQAYQAFNDLLKADISGMRIWEIEEQRSMLDQKVSALREYHMLTRDMEDQATAYRIALGQKEADLKRAQMAMVLSQGGAMLMGLGKQNLAIFRMGQAMSIAAAIMNTYEGATKALAQGGIYGAALAAIVIATGLAQVAQIASQKPPEPPKGYAIGTDYVPQTGYALLHQGEAVIPASANSRRFSGDGLGGVTNNFDFSGLTVDSDQRVRDLAERIGYEIERGRVSWGSIN